MVHCKVLWCNNNLYLRHLHRSSSWEKNLMMEGGQEGSFGDYLVEILRNLSVKGLEIIWFSGMML